MSMLNWYPSQAPQRLVARTVFVDVQESDAEYALKFASGFISPAEVDAARGRVEFKDETLTVRVPKTAVVTSKPAKVA